MATILGLDHQPIPPSGIVDRIRQVDPHLDLMWGEGAFGAPGWWVIYRWPESDKRRSMIARGEMHPADAWDWFARLPPDCPVDQAYGYIVNAFRSSGHKEAKRLLGRTGEYNREVQRAHVQPILDDAMNMIEVNASKLFAKEYGEIPKVRMGQRAPAKRGKTAKEIK